MTTSGRDAPQGKNYDSAIAEVLGDRYEVVEKLGSGAFGEVYKAKDTTLGRMVAIKRIRLDAFAEGAQLEEVKKRFMREAQVAAQLRHPNIVTTHDIVAGPKASFIVMELVEGDTLHSFLQSKGRLSLEETIEVLSQAARALDHAHSQKVVHRDVKPANFMIDSSSGQVKVMDFGMAKAESSGQITATGTILGTPNYMSPEQAKGQPVDGRSDLFSLGCIAYECLTGTRPFRGDQITAILLKIVNEDPPPIQHESLGLPESVGAVLARALDKDPGKRYATGAELLEALRSVATGSPSPELTAGVTALSKAPEREPEAPALATVRKKDLLRARRWIPAAAAGLAVAVLAFWIASGSTTEDSIEVAEDSASESSSSVVVEDVGFFGRLVGADPKLHITVPAGSALVARLETPLTSETAAVGDEFSLTTNAPIVIEDYEAIAAGSRIEGHVAHAAGAGKVSGLGELTLEFDRLVTTEGEEFPLDAEPFHRKARSTKKKDAVKVGGAAGIGALVGGLFGGKKGAAIGGAVGGGAGAGVVLATKGEEVVLGEGAELTVQLKAPITVTIALKPAEE